MSDITNTPSDTVNTTSDRPDIHSDTLTTQQAARHFDVSERTILRWIKSGNLHAEMVQGHWVIRLHEHHIRHDEQKPPTNPTNAHEQVIKELQSETVRLKDQLKQADFEASHLSQSLEEKNDEIRHLRDQLRAKDTQIDHLTQLLAIAQKSVQQLTAQNQLLLEVTEGKLVLSASKDARGDQRKPFWKRLFRR